VRSDDDERRDREVDPAEGGFGGGDDVGADALAEGAPGVVFECDAYAVGSGGLFDEHGGVWVRMEEGGLREGDMIFPCRRSEGNMEMALSCLGMVGFGSGFLVRSAPVEGVLIARILGF
jgi:hypothetical protein